MTPISIGIALAMLGVKMLTNADVVKLTKQLVKDIDSSDLTGQEKTEYVMKQLKQFFNDVLPIFIEVVIKIVVLDMQNSNGTLKKKLKEVKDKNDK